MHVFDLGTAISRYEKHLQPLCDQPLPASSGGHPVSRQPNSVQLIVDDNAGKRTVLMFRGVRMEIARQIQVQEFSGVGSSVVGQLAMGYEFILALIPTVFDVKVEIAVEDEAPKPVQLPMRRIQL